MTARTYMYDHHCLLTTHGKNWRIRRAQYRGMLLDLQLLDDDLYPVSGPDAIGQISLSGTDLGAYCDTAVARFEYQMDISNADVIK